MSDSAGFRQLNKVVESISVALDEIGFDLQLSEDDRRLMATGDAAELASNPEYEVWGPLLHDCATGVHPFTVAMDLAVLCLEAELDGVGDDSDLRFEVAEHVILIAGNLSRYRSEGRISNRDGMNYLSRFRMLLGEGRRYEVALNCLVEASPKGVTTSVYRQPDFISGEDDFAGDSEVSKKKPALTIVK